MKRTALALLVLMACTEVQTRAPTCTLRWRWNAPAPAYAGMPAAAHGLVLLTYGHSFLVALRSGHVAWETERIGLRDVAPAVMGDAVVAPTDDGVATFALADGAPRGDLPLGDRASTPVPLAGGFVVTLWDGAVVVPGRWRVALPDASFGPPAAADGVVVASWTWGVVALDGPTGRTLWRHTFGGTGTSAPAIASGAAVIVAPDGRAHAYDLQTGRQRWSFPIGGAGAAEAPPAVRRTQVAVADRHGRLAVLDARNGRRRWSAEGDGAVERAGPVFVGGAVALPLDDGRLLVAGPRGHTVEDPPGRVSGLAATDGQLVVATREAAANGIEVLAVE